MSNAPSNAASGAEILSVTDLNRQARITLEERFRQVWVMGELSNFARPRSGHWYFTLKDESAQARCAMFANRNRAVQMQPGDGQLVLVRGRVSLYEGRGDFQIIVDYMEPAGTGALQRAFEALKVKLRDEGMFDTARKKPLPALPMHCAVITSPTGAALRDVIAVWRRRSPMLQVTLIPTSVQGNDAEQQIIAALAQVRRLHALQPVDVAILTRGGGSLEDLWSFNLETVARALVGLPVPIISAVGHEIDVTITDFVADVRAPTPSAAAEMVAPDAQQLSRQVTATYARARHLLQGLLRLQRLTVHNTRLRIPSPAHLLERSWLRLDDQQGRLQRALQRGLAQRSGALGHMARRVANLNPYRSLANLRSRVAVSWRQLARATTQHRKDARRRFEDNVRLLGSLSPLPTLQRGYAVVMDTQGHVVTASQQLKGGDEITAHLAHGQLTATVKSLKNKGLSDQLKNDS